MKRLLLSFLLAITLVSCRYEEDSTTTSYCDSGGCIYCREYDDGDVFCWGTGAYGSHTEYYKTVPEDDAE